MSVTAITGAVTTAKLNSVRIVPDVEKKIVLYEPSAAPLAVILLRLPKNNSTSFKKEWLDRQALPYYVLALAAGDITGTSTLTIADYNIIRLGEILINERTNEVIRVSTAPTTSTVTVYRGIGTTHDAILATDKLFRAGTASEQGSGMPEAKTVQDTNVYNYNQIFKTATSTTGTANATTLVGSSNVALERKIAGINHTIEMEVAICWNELGAITGESGDPIYTMRGLCSPAGFILTNRYDAVNGFTEDDFNEYLDAPCDLGSDRKLGVGGNVALSSINAFCRDKLQVIHPSKEEKKLNYGISIANWNHPSGSTISLVRSRSWRGASKSRSLAILDLALIAMCPLRNTVFKTNVQDSKTDRIEDSWLTETTIMLRVEEAHAFIENM